VKNKHASVSLDQHSLKAAWEGVIRGINAKESSTAFRSVISAAKSASRLTASASRKVLK
jgi:hypothetical protein